MAYDVTLVIIEIWYYYVLVVGSHSIAKAFSLLIKNKATFIPKVSSILLTKVALNFVVNILTSSALFKRIVSKSCYLMLDNPNMIMCNLLAMRLNSAEDVKVFTTKFKATFDKRMDDTSSMSIALS